MLKLGPSTLQVKSLRFKRDQSISKLESVGTLLETVRDPPIHIFLSRPDPQFLLSNVQSELLQHPLL